MAIQSIFALHTEDVHFPCTKYLQLDFSINADKRYYDFSKKISTKRPLLVVVKECYRSCLLQILLSSISRGTLQHFFFGMRRFSRVEYM